MRQIIELELLVTVKAYPNPSRDLSEAVCAAGISKKLGLVRLYPIPFWDLSDNQKFAKYQLIRLRVRTPKQDKRPNTFRPLLDTIEIIGTPLPTMDNWRLRKKWVFPVASESMYHIQSEQQRSGLSLGVFKPAEVIDVEQEEAENKDWSASELARLQQQDLFLRTDKSLLEKIPYNWSYRYRCSAPECRTHCQQIIDWEIAELYRNLKNNGITDSATIHEKVRQKFLHELCGIDRDTYFFTGNMAKRPQNFLILGVFWPHKDPQMKLLQ